VIRTLESVAHAKLNLTLRLVGKRADGMHFLDGLTAFTAFGDRVRIVTGQSEDSIRVSGRFASRLIGENIVSVALDRYRSATPIAGGLSIEIEKNIPIAAGLGGGSCDAGTVLRMLQSIAPAPLDADSLGALAVTLGADVPVCLESAGARMRGTGDVLAPAGPLPSVTVLLVNPWVELTAGQVFRRFQGPFSAPAVVPDDVSSEDGLLAFMGRRARNDLIAPATEAEPVIAEVLDFLSEVCGARSTGMSGSGATCFAIFSGGDAHTVVLAENQARQRGWWAQRTTLLP
jgi:4-diphosphocytidyl-2-C-methyl-D-erythritol kinase